MKQTPESLQREEIATLLKEILGVDYLQIDIEKFTINEDLKCKTCEIICELTLNDYTSVNKNYLITGTGAGAVDAFFNAIVNELLGDYSSLGAIQFEDFFIKAQFQKSKKTNAFVEAVLIVTNSNNRELHFRNESRSMNAAAISVVTGAIEHIVNTEVAVLKTYVSIRDAYKRNRQDLISEYTRHLSELVTTTSYEVVLEEYKKKFDKDNKR